MKKTIAITAILGAICCAATAQKKDKTGDAPKDYPKFYVKAAGGYFLSVSPGQFPNVGTYEPHETYYTLNTTTGAETTVSDKVLTGSYGKGVRGGGTFGMNFNRYIGMELTFNYYHSAQNLMTKQVTTSETTSQTLGDIESNGHVNALDIAPSIVISPGHYSGLNPYVRFGFVVPIWGRLKIGTDASVTGSTTSGSNTYITQTAVHREEEVKPNVALGFQGALGVTYPISKCLDVFIETEYRNIPVKSKSKEVKKYSETTAVISPTTGATVQTITKNLSDLTVAERETVYQTTLDQSSNTVSSSSTSTLHPTYKNDNAPSNDLKSYINIGGLGFNVGIKIGL